MPHVPLRESILVVPPISMMLFAVARIGCEVLQRIMTQGADGGFALLHSVHSQSPCRIGKNVTRHLDYLVLYAPEGRGDKLGSPQLGETKVGRPHFYNASRNLFKTTVLKRHFRENRN
jgi:hypothetical protein